MDTDPVDQFANAADMPAIRPRTWALVKDGFVSAVKRSTDHLMHPFGEDATGHVVLDVTGVPCAIGYVADHKGNVAPSDGRTEALLPHEPAYHAHSTVAAAPAAVTENDVAGGEPHPLETEGGHDHTTDNDVDVMRAEHPTAGLVQEHGLVQGEVKADDQPG